jgi:hypothetical protein
MPVAFDGFEAAVVELVGAGSPALGAVVAATSEAMETGWPGLTRVGLTPVGVASLGARRLAALGVPGPRAEALVAVARAARGTLRLEPGAEPAATLEVLRGIPDIDAVAATAIVMRAMHWPDAFSPGCELQRLWRAATPVTEHARRGCAHAAHAARTAEPPARGSRKPHAARNNPAQTPPHYRISRCWERTCKLRNERPQHVLIDISCLFGRNRHAQESQNVVAPRDHMAQSSSRNRGTVTFVVQPWNVSAFATVPCTSTSRRRGLDVRRVGRLE